MGAERNRRTFGPDSTIGAMAICPCHGLLFPFPISSIPPISQKKTPLPNFFCCAKCPRIGRQGSSVELAEPDFAELSCESWPSCCTEDSRASISYESAGRADKRTGVRRVVSSLPLEILLLAHKPATGGMVGMATAAQAAGQSE
jgi:hypothetical protein